MLCMFYVFMKEIANKRNTDWFRKKYLYLGPRCPIFFSEWKGSKIFPYTSISKSFIRQYISDKFNW